jgi:hypothetical protein
LERMEIARKGTRGGARALVVARIIIGKEGELIKRRIVLDHRHPILSLSRDSGARDRKRGKRSSSSRVEFRRVGSIERTKGRGRAGRAMMSTTLIVFQTLAPTVGREVVVLWTLQWTLLLLFRESLFLLLLLARGVTEVKIIEVLLYLRAMAVIAAVAMARGGETRGGSRHI